MTQSMPPEAARMMTEALRQSMPNLKTQAQFTAFMLAFDSFRLLCDSIFSNDRSREEDARAAFEQAIAAIQTATELGAKFEEIPLESRSTAANPFTQPPVQFQEYDIQKKLLAELTRITSIEDLRQWYDSTKPQRDQVVSQTLRNVLLDRIRQKKELLLRKGDPSS